MCHGTNHQKYKIRICPRDLVSTGPQVPWHLWLLEAIQEKLEICSQNVLLLASFSELGTCGNEILTRALNLVHPVNPRLEVDL